MKKIIVLLVTVSIFLVGGSKKHDISSYDKYLKEGKKAVANEEYDNARNLFSLAKEENKNKEEADALYKQTNNLVEAIDSKEKKHYDVAIQLCLSIERIKSESNIIKSVAKDLKKECEDLKNNPTKEDKKEKEEKEDKEDKKEKEEKEVTKEKKETVKSSAAATKIINDYNKKAKEAENLTTKENGTYRYQDKLINILRSYDTNDLESAKTVYELSDEMLNNLYKSLKTDLDKDSLNKLKREQIQWLDEKMAKEKGLSKDKLFMYQSLALVTINRCEKFNERYYK